MKATVERATGLLFGTFRVNDEAVPPSMFVTAGWMPPDRDCAAGERRTGVSVSVGRRGFYVCRNPRALARR